METVSLTRPFQAMAVPQNLSLFPYSQQYVFWEPCVQVYVNPCYVVFKYDFMGIIFTLYLEEGWLSWVSVSQLKLAEPLVKGQVEKPLLFLTVLKLLIA